MKTFRVEAKLHIAAFVQAETEEAAISEVADLLEWPGGLLDEEYTAKECICSDVLDWMNKNNRFCFGDLTVVHGRWIEKKRWSMGKWHKWLECSRCGHQDHNLDMYEDMPFTAPSNYCPNCGTRMDGE